MNVIKRLQVWYQRECNGDWEHSFGVRIETLDNPGWLVEIDLAETEWEDLQLAREIDERSESDWVQYEVCNQKFVGCGGPGNLEEILHFFFALIYRGGTSHLEGDTG